LGESSLAFENLRKAYELCDRLSEGEKLEIESEYYNFATGDFEKARQSFEVWAQSYPRDWLPPLDLGEIYIELGQYEKALAAYREALCLSPESGQAHGPLVYTYVSLDRTEEARATAEGRWRNKSTFLTDTASLHACLCTTMRPGWLSR
jgi:tetratricopeptide (TPR) repeat protein